MSIYCPTLVRDLTDRLNAMTGLALTQNDVFRELEAMRAKYAPDGGGVPTIPFTGGVYIYESPATPLPEFTFRPLAKDLPLTPDEALTRLHTMRPADPAFTRTYLGDAS